MLTVLSHPHQQLCLHNGSSVHSRTIQSVWKLHRNSENAHVKFSDDVNICRLLPWKSHSHCCLTSYMTWMWNKSWPASTADNWQEILVQLLLWATRRGGTLSHSKLWLCKCTFICLPRCTKCTQFLQHILSFGAYTLLDTGLFTIGWL